MEDHLTLSRSFLDGVGPTKKQNQGGLGQSWVVTKTTWILIREEGGRENPLSNLAGRCDMVAPTSIDGC